MEYPPFSNRLFSQRTKPPLSSGMSQPRLRTTEDTPADDPCQATEFGDALDQRCGHVLVIPGDTPGQPPHALR